MSAPVVFISHTPETEPAQARRLASDLTARLGPERVLGVTDGVDGGGEDSIRRCDVLLAVIAAHWSGADDSFAHEIELALGRRIPVIPVLILGAKLPGREALPDDLKPLRDHYPRCALEIPSDFFWEVSVAHLARWLVAIGEENGGRAKAKEAAAEHRRRLERELQRARERLAESETAVAAAERRRASVDSDLQLATEELGRRQSEIGPAGVGTGIRVFISYRPESSGDARKLESDLKERLQRGRVFSTEPVPEGADPDTTISERIARCDALLAIVGPNWLTTADGSGRPRLQDPQDPIRLEAEAAFRRGLPVIPVLTQHSAKPEADALPEGLRPLAAQSALELLVPFWNDGLNDVIGRLGQLEARLQQGRRATEEAADRHRKLERDAAKARDEQARAESGLAAAKDTLAGLENDLRRAQEEDERLVEEHADSNRAFLEGPGEDVGTTATRGGERRIGTGGGDQRLLLVAGAIVVVLVIVVVALAGH